VKPAWDDWRPYIAHEFGLVDFGPGQAILDLGCGEGDQLELISARGGQAVGLEVDHGCLARCRARGLRVIEACAEMIPMRAASVDGVVCKVVIPYTAECDALREIGRVLRRRGRAHIVYHGAGYYLRYLLTARRVPHRIYAARVFLNSWWYAATQRRLPGFLGDTMYQTRRRLQRYYERYHLTLALDCPSPRFLGAPVFIYHAVERGDC
jgi:ubiquinone/menaquinone biosynthesis C-methylase UbiE